LNRRDFLSSTLAAGVPVSILGPPLLFGAEAPAAEEPGVAVLLVDTGRPEGRINSRIYGHFLEHINHSVEDGLFAEQIRGAGFEGDDFRTYWQPFSDRGTVSIAAVDFQNGRKSVRLEVSGGRAGIRQRRVYMEAGRKYDGSLWVQRQAGSPALTLRIIGADGAPIVSLPLPVSGSAPSWHEVPFSFASPVRDAQATVEIAASGTGALLVDFVSMMRADVRGDGMFRVDLLGALRDLRPTFIRWPGGSFASTYQWTEGIGRYAARGYHPNTFWGGYSDYYGFGTDEFLGLCRKLNAEPLIVLPAPGGQPDQVDYAMNWVHYLNDLSDTKWGRLRATNGHPEPYGVRFFQIDNEPMNNGFTPESYAALVNLYGSRLREIAPEARIVACGQKRSNDMEWSEKVIDLAGDNFDILGCHNYEYEPDNFETGLRRIRDYLVKLRDYARASAHPAIEIAVLEWSLQHTYDWRAGLHTAGSLIMYEELSPALGMTCPALLMRNTTDDPTWTSFIYHNHVSWFPGAGYVVEKLFRENFAERRLASTTGVFRDIRDRTSFFDRISSMKPEGWQPGAVDAIATASADGRRIVIKAVNYQAQANTLLVRLQGSAVPDRASATLHTITARLTDAASLGQPDAIAPVARSLNYAKDLTIELNPHSVAVVEIRKG
jgi:alpha-N-arabinofuranosidase